MRWMEEENKYRSKLEEEKNRYKSGWEEEEKKGNPRKREVE